MDHDALIKYLNENSSPEEKAAIEDWIQANPENQAYFQKVKKVWETRAKEPEAPNIDAAWKKVRQSIEVEPKVRRLPNKVWRMAAAVAVLLIAFSVWYQLQPAPMITASRTGQPEVLKVDLPDGSTAWLNRNSSLNYPEEFNGKERRLELSGEAYFEVQRDENRPFRVVTDQTVTEVLGTSFNLMAYPDSARQWVQVHSGKVAFSTNKENGQSIILEQQEGAFYDSSNQSITSLQKWEGNALAWKSGKLAFDDTPMNEVVNILNKAYGVEIILANPTIADCRLNSTHEGESLEEILNAIAIIFELEEKRDNNIITLSGAGCD